MSREPILITGFEPYGGRGSNPAAEIARALDGREIAGTAVIGRTLPVSYRELRERVQTLIREVDPVAVISLGLWPGEVAIRIERLGINLADFEIPDNEGALVADALIGGNAATGFAVTLPVKQIERAVLDAGIPARLSTTAGTFLCNACLWSVLETVSHRSPAPLCGFIHLPYMPSQVAELLADLRREARLELHQHSDLASMHLPLQQKAIEIAIATTLAAMR